MFMCGFVGLFCESVCVAMGMLAVGFVVYELLGWICIVD